MTKALFFDIDGTLVSFNTHRVPDSTVMALTAAKRKGLGIFISTGRPPLLIDNLSSIGHLIDGYVTTNGAFCYKGNTTVLKEPLLKEDVTRMWEMSCENDFCVLMSGIHGLYLNGSDPATTQMLGNLMKVPLINEHCSLKEVLDDEILQMSPLISPSEEIEILGCLQHTVAYRWIPLFCDIVRKDVSKARGIHAMCSFCNLEPQECMAVGDGGNDIPMFGAVGISVAMGNAAESVKAHAGHVTDTVDNDGILKALQHFEII